MGQRKQFHGKRNNRPAGPRGSSAREPIVIPPPKPPVNYGQPFIVMEDAAKGTFVFTSGAWVPFAMTIAQCRTECQVQQLPQKVNGMTRYEIRQPVA